ncbi:MAG: hypothetical protein WCD69_01850 [Xanthobacteraceae bacterium]
MAANNKLGSRESGKSAKLLIYYTRERSMVLFSLANWGDHHQYRFIASFPLATEPALGNLSRRAK